MSSEASACRESSEIPASGRRVARVTAATSGSAQVVDLVGHRVDLHLERLEVALVRVDVHTVASSVAKFGPDAVDVDLKLLKI